MPSYSCNVSLSQLPIDFDSTGKQLYIYSAETHTPVISSHSISSLKANDFKFLSPSAGETSKLQIVRANSFKGSMIPENFNLEVITVLDQDDSDQEPESRLYLQFNGQGTEFSGDHQARSHYAGRAPKKMAVHLS